MQLLAGMWEFVRKNTFGALAFSSFGAFWISYYVLVKFVAQRTQGQPRCRWPSASSCWAGRSSPST